MGVEGVGCGGDVLGAAVNREEDGGVDADAHGGVGIGVEAAHRQDRHRADVDAVHKVAPALGIADIQVGDFQQGWGAGEGGDAVAVDRDERDAIEVGDAGFVNAPAGTIVFAPQLIPTFLQNAHLLHFLFSEAAHAFEGDFVDADLREGALGVVVFCAPAAN